MSDAVFKAVVLCQRSELRPGQCREFKVEDARGQSHELFLVDSENHVYAYHNQCPHTGVNLNWQPEQFLDVEARFIQCSTHGALFRIEDGLCVRGPCVGQSLTPVPLRVQNGEICLGD